MSIDVPSVVRVDIAEQEVAALSSDDSSPFLNWQDGLVSPNLLARRSADAPLDAVEDGRVYAVVDDQDTVLALAEIGLHHSTWVGPTTEIFSLQTHITAEPEVGLELVEYIANDTLDSGRDRLRMMLNPDNQMLDFLSTVGLTEVGSKEMTISSRAPKLNSSEQPAVTVINAQPSSAEAVLNSIKALGEYEAAIEGDDFYNPDMVQVGEQQWRQTLETHHSERSQQILLAKFGTQTVGCAVAHLSGHENGSPFVYLEDLFIKEAFRNNPDIRAGTAIFSHLAQSYGMPEVRFVVSYNNAESQKAYAALGAEETGRVEINATGDALARI